MKPSPIHATPPARPGPAPQPAAQPAEDFTMVVLGDSLSAGTQDATTVADRQQMCYAKQLADAAGIPFNMPLIKRPGIPFEVFPTGRFEEEPFQGWRDLLVHSLAPLAAWTYYIGVPSFLYPAVWDILGAGVRDPETRSTRERPQHNFAVPGMEARHLSTLQTARQFLTEIHDKTTKFDEVGDKIPLLRALLQEGGRKNLGSQVDRAVALKPDLAVVWAGANDALEAAFAGRVDDRTLTPVEDRPWNIRDMTPLGNYVERTTEKPMPGVRTAFVGPQGSLTRLLDETDAEILALTVPDVGLIPNLIPLGGPVGPLPFRVVLKDGTDVTPQLERLVLPNNVAGPGKNGRLVFPAGSKVPLIAMLEMFLRNGPVDTDQQFQQTLFKVAGLGWFNEDQVLDPDEQDEIRQRVEGYNQVLRDAAAANPRIHLVDVADEMRKAQTTGRPLRGQGAPVTVTTTYTGVQDPRGFHGIFSYDGAHPSDTGHAVIANMVLDHIKAHLSGNPKFARFANLAPVDEKKVFLADPHLHNRGTLVLDAGRVEQMKTMI